MRMNSLVPPAGMVGGWPAGAGRPGAGSVGRPAMAGGRGGLLRRPVPSRGGQLEVAGVVVCSWGANYGSRGAPSAAHLMGQPHGRPMPPQVTSVGVKQYRGFGCAGAFPRQGQRPSFPVRGPGIRGTPPARGKRTQVTRLEAG